MAEGNSSLEQVPVTVARPEFFDGLHPNRDAVSREERTYQSAVTAFLAQTDPGSLPSKLQHLSVAREFTFDLAHHRLPISPDRVLERITASQQLALLALLQTGQIETLYQSYLQTAAQNGQPLTQSPADIKAQLASIFLSRLTAKNQETSFSQLPGGPISHGLEVEYIPPEEELIIGPENETSLHWLQRQVLSRLVAHRSGQSYRAVADALSLDDPLAATVAKTKVFDQKDEPLGAMEIASQPSASPLTSLRDLLKAAESGAISGDFWNLHLTLSGLQLTPDHTEAMDITAIAVGAGFSAISKTKFDEFTISEHVGKISRTDSGECYFPFHRLRWLNRTMLYPSPQTNSNTAVEFRSLLNFPEGNFATLVRCVTFNFYAALGARAFQKSADHRNPVEAQLAAAWENLLATWNQRLAAVDLDNPDNTDRFIALPPTDNYPYVPRKFIGKTGYEKFITQIRQQAEDPSFVQKNRDMITAYQKTVKSIIGVH